MLLFLLPYLKPVDKSSLPLSSVDVQSTLLATNPVSVAYTLISSTQQVLYTSTPSLTVTPMVSPTVDYHGVYYDPLPEYQDIYTYRLSFYDPEIGDHFPDIAFVNCMLWDVVTSTCNSTMANGEPFYMYYRKAIACPPPLRHGTLVRVLYPPQLVGDWTCMDRGYAVTDTWMDFLLKYPDDIWTGYDLTKFPWGDTVQVNLIQP